MYERQRAVAMFFIDRLALRAGNEKDTDEAADTVGCCSLRVEHVKVHKDFPIDGENQPYVVEFDFLGKDSMRYHNFLPVSKVRPLLSDFSLTTFLARLQKYQNLYGKQERL